MIDEITLENTILNKQIKLSKTDYKSDIVLESVDFGTVEATHKTYKGINQIGETLQGTSIGTREVSIVGWIIGEDDAYLEKIRREFNSFVNPLQGIKILYKDYLIDMIADSSIKYSTSEEENNEVMCKFMIQGTCVNPMFYDKEQNKISIANIEKKFMFPLILKPEGIQLGIRQPSLFTTIINKGNIETGFELVFKALGTVVNPSLTNVVTQEYLKINKTMVAGEEIRINSNDGEKTIYGYLNGVKSNYYRYKDYGSTWLRLAIGENIFRYNAEENISSLEVTISFSNKYFEVQ